MQSIHVRRESPATAMEMFTLLSDPATYLEHPDVKLAELLRPGTDTRHGVGALRRIWFGPFRYDEVITRSDPGERLDYLVVSSRPALHHEGGTIHFTPTPSGCTVDWKTTYRVPIPVIGPLVGLVGGWRMRQGFEDAIRIAGELAVSQRTQKEVEVTLPPNDERPRIAGVHGGGAGNRSLRKRDCQHGNVARLSTKGFGFSAFPPFSEVAASCQELPESAPILGEGLEKDRPSIPGHL